MKISRKELIIATNHIKAQDKELANIIEREKECRLTLVKEISPFYALMKSIAGQQLHARAADAILNRLMALNNGQFPTPEQIVVMDAQLLTQCGFSGRKIISLKKLAQETLQGNIPDWKTAQQMSDQAILETLTRLPGIGEWTVQMMLIFNLGRLDIMPVGDFAIREGWRLCKDLSVQPTPKVLYQSTLSWRPYRTIGAWFLWRIADERKPVEKQNKLTL